ncbi:hypothetical protein WISP_121079 [Willisornis vidua]|uniref:Uncharacterized protein n=1 Tax=Willisornis vidua TaxID=1566151 RepID=A0ABQ9CXU3_9PASS|nr:hypothetical protein WISP_121079 [Willisornis vidua]
MDDNFMEQILKELTEKDGLLHLLLVNTVDLVSKVKIGGCLGHSDHKVIEYKICQEEKCQETSTPDTRRSDFRMLRELVKSPVIKKESLVLELADVSNVCKQALLTQLGKLGVEREFDCKVGKKTLWRSLVSSYKKRKLCDRECDIDNMEIES